MRRELIDLSTAYLMGWKTLRDCAEWLAGIDWNDLNLEPETLDVVGSMELLATEVMEGLRPEAEFWQEAANFVERETNSIYTRQVLITESNVANSFSDAPNRLLELTVMEPGVSQSWSISPLPVSA